MTTKPEEGTDRDLRPYEASHPQETNPAISDIRLPGELPSSSHRSPTELEEAGQSLCIWLAAAALASVVLCLVLPMLAAVWALAVKDGHVPPGPWGEHPGNHGPWRRVYNLRNLLGSTIELPLSAFGLGAFSNLLVRSWVSVWVMAGSVAVVAALAWSHYWLID